MNSRVQKKCHTSDKVTRGGERCETFLCNHWRWWTKNGGSLTTMLRDKSSVLTSMLRAGMDGKDPGKVTELQDHVNVLR